MIQNFRYTMIYSQILYILVYTTYIFQKYELYTSINQCIHIHTYILRLQPQFTQNQVCSALRRRRVSSPRLLLASLAASFLRVVSSRQTTSFNDFSIEAGILLRGNGVPHAMLVRVVSSTLSTHRRGLLRPNCHIHGLTSYTLLQRLPSTAAELAQPIGKPESLRLLYK